MSIYIHETILKRINICIIILYMYTYYSYTHIFHIIYNHKEHSGDPATSTFRKYSNNVINAQFENLIKMDFYI